jgi:endonuclease/exonuclease/phosphatase family metal-dependent hydrolase
LRCFVELIDRERVDILLLQEILRTNDFEADKWLGEELGMAYIYSRSNGNAPDIGFEEGLAIFSRFPIKDHRLAQLSDQSNPFLRRMALGTKIETGIGDILAFSVHLGISGNQNKKQVTRLKDWVEDEAGSIPAVIGGDFNAHEDTPQIRSTKSLWHDSFRAVNPTGDGYSHEIRWPWGNVLRRSRLDYLFLRSGYKAWTVEEAQHIDDHNCALSDHKPVLIRTSFSVQD